MGQKTLPRILHANVFTNLPTGVLNQLKAEHEATKVLGIPWKITAWCTDSVDSSFVRTFPTKCNSVIRRRLHFLRWLKQEQNNYDIILLRHPLSDPFLWFYARNFKFRVSVHHTKEIEECPTQRSGLLGKIAIQLEQHFGTQAITLANGIIGVTSEIAEYELKRTGQHKPYLVMPNGIDTTQVTICQDQRGQTPRLLFVASHFAAWHGLDLLLDALEVNPELDCIIDVVGKTEEADQQRILQTPSLANRIILHGKLDTSNIQKLASIADVGLSSFALSRNAMSEACTLKVREYLAMGLPVYAGHHDSGLPNNYLFYRNGACCLPAILTAVHEWKTYSRTEVRESAIPWIEKRELIHRTYKWLTELYLSTAKF